MVARLQDDVDDTEEAELRRLEGGAAPWVVVNARRAALCRGEGEAGLERW